MNEPEYSKFNFPSNVKKVCVNAHHYSFAEQLKFLKILNREKCDLVHFSHFNLPFFYRGKFIVTIHDTTISFYPGKKMNSWWRKCAYNLVIRNAVRRAEKIITVSDNTAQDVQRLFGIKREKMKTIWNGIGEEFKEISNAEKSEVREKFGLSQKFLLYTGNWREHKNLVGLLQAFSKIVSSVTNGKFSDLQLVITGKADPYYPEVQQTIKTLGLQDFVKLVGLVNQKDLVGLYNTASAYAFPSFYEGFGLPPLEAMACGTPVSASHVSAIPEVCGDAVQYFDPKNSDDMAEKISKLLMDKNMQENLITKGKERIKLFSWDKSAEQTLKIYQSTLQ